MSTPTLSDAQVVQLAQSRESTVRALAREVERLRAAIRKHMSKRGHEPCWLNDVELWRTLNPDATYPHESLPVREEFLAQCARYYESRVKGTPYAEPKVTRSIADDR